MGRGETDAIRQFREFARRYSRVERFYRNACETGTGDRVTESLSLKQAIENEFNDCFLLTKNANWDAVVAAANGETR